MRRSAFRPFRRDRRPPPARRSDPAGPLTAGAFFLGLVVAAVTLLGVQANRGDTVPARTHTATVADLAATDASLAGAERELLVARGALDDAAALARRLADALDNPDLTEADRAALRREVARQTTIIRERVRVLRVPAAAPAARAPDPSPAPTPQAPARDPSPAGTPSADPCALRVLGACLIPNPAPDPRRTP